MSHIHPNSPKNLTEKPPPGKSAGKLMLYIGWLIVLAGLTVFFGEWEKKTTQPQSKP